MAQLRLFGQAGWSGSALAPRGELPDALPGYLLALLALRGDWVGREALVSLFWPDRPPAQALHNLRANLHRARALLQEWGCPHALQSEPRRVRWQVPSDVAQFRAAVGNADWSLACDLHRAPLWEAASCRGFVLVDEWLRAERQALMQAFRAACLNAVRTVQRAGQAAAAAGLLLRLLEMLERQDEYAEDAVQALLAVASAADCRDTAWAHYRRLVQCLHDEAGTGPAAATKALALALRGAPPATGGLAVPALPAGLKVPPQLVGREAERQRVADTGCPLLVVAGEPGVGKTRLLHEALPGATWIECREGLSEVPFGPLIEWLADQVDAIDASPAQRLVLARLVPSWAGGEQLPPGDATKSRQELLAALAELLCARRRPIVVDDLQWADAATRDLLVDLVRSPQVPLRLAHRSQEATAEIAELLDRLGAACRLEALCLEPLDIDATSALLASLSRSDAAPPAFARWLHAQSGGNPFFLLQTLRLLFETGRLAAEADGWSSPIDPLTSDYAELQVPPLAAELVQRRVQALSAVARRVLGLAAVAGDARAEAAIGAVLDLAAPEVAAALAELQSAGLLRGARFVHDLVRQSIYRQLPAALRTVLHAGVARCHGEALHAEQRAAHWWLAGAVEPAIEASLAAAAALRQRGLHGDALVLIDSALARSLASAQRSRLLAARARIRLEQGHGAAAESDVRALLVESAAATDRAEGLLVLAALRIEQGRIDEAGSLCDQAESIAPQHPRLADERARIANLRGRSAEVVSALEARLAELRLAPAGVDRVLALASLASAYDELGQVERGLPMLQEAYSLAGAIGARYAQVQVAVALLWNLSAQGRDEEGVAIAEQALALGEYDSTPTLRNNLSWSLRQLGRVDRAAALCEQLIAGSDPTLALIARGRLLEMRGEDPRWAGRMPALVDTLLAACSQTEVYLARASAVRAVLRVGNDEQVRRACAWLDPRVALDPWLHESLAAALRRRGFDPATRLGPSAAAS